MQGPVPKSVVLLCVAAAVLGCTARAGRHFSARTTVASIEPYSARLRGDYCAEKAYDLDRRNRAYRSWRDTTLVAGLVSLTAAGGMMLVTGPVNDDDHTRSLQIGSAATAAAGAGLLLGAAILERARIGLEEESQRAISGAATITDLGERLRGEISVPEQTTVREGIVQAFQNCLSSSGADDQATQDPTPELAAAAVVESKAAPAEKGASKSAADATRPKQSAARGAYEKAAPAREGPSEPANTSPANGTLAPAAGDTQKAGAAGAHGAPR